MIVSGHCQRRPVVLTFVRYYLPGYKSGGPVRSISNLVETLGDEFDFRILTSDRDATDSFPFPSIRPNEWNVVGKAQVWYLPANRALSEFRRLLRETPHDIVYLNSFFDPDFTIKPLVLRRLRQVPAKRWMLAPRGELSEGALQLKAWKKKSFIAAARLTGLLHGLEWHASSIHEEADIRRRLTAAKRITVAANLPEMGQHQAHRFVPRIRGEPLRIVFLSRISPMKNLDYALKILRQVTVNVRLDIYGPVRDHSYWTICQAIIAKLPQHVEANYCGEVEHLRVASVLARYDLFFLPTLGENYGHVILEALAVGTPVLISDTTPWRGLSQAGVGWDLPLNEPGDFAAKIELASSFTAAEQLQKRDRVVGFAEDHKHDPGIVKAAREMFIQAIQ
jgi:glycosyltransferase involved in cell wall biosynthesis